MTARHLSRRTFLKGGAVLAASLPLASLVSACATGKPAVSAASEGDEAPADQTTENADEVPQVPEPEPQADPAPEPAPEPSTSEAGSVLVAYYSATGNTERVARTIIDHLGADTFVITPVVPYTTEDLNWRSESSRVCVEHDDPEGRHVELVQVAPENFESYDTIFVGYPTWWQHASWVMDDFVQGNDFNGKTIIPFTTSSSSPLGESAIDLAALAGTGAWQEGVRFQSGASEAEVLDWLDGLAL